VAVGIPIWDMTGTPRAWKCWKTVFRVYEEIGTSQLPAISLKLI